MILQECQKMLDLIAQISISILGPAAIYLMGSKQERLRMWGGILGMCGEPFWLTTSILHDQWGIILMCFIYAPNYFRAFWNNGGSEIIKGWIK